MCNALELEQDVLPFFNDCGGFYTTVQGHSYSKFYTQKKETYSAQQKHLCHNPRVLLRCKWGQQDKREKAFEHNEYSAD